MTMPDHERAMLAFVRLAALSQEKQQLGGRDKFLLLTAAEALRAGWPEVAERCREMVLANNRVHLVHRYATMADAMRDEEFQTFLKQLERFCGQEKAEHLLNELDIEIDVPPARRDAGAGPFALDLLAERG
jgi:hypothetical protein